MDAINALIDTVNGWHYGFNALCSFNTTDFICNYVRNVPHMTTWVGIALSALAGLVIFAGSQFKAAFAWNLSDLIMGVMALINIPVCVYLGKNVYKALWDYMIQRNSGKEPTFDPEKVLGTSEGMECWMESGPTKLCG